MKVPVVVPKRVIGPVSGIPLHTAEDVLAPIEDVLRTLQTVETWDIWKGAHLASLTQLERDCLANARGMIERVGESVARRRDALEQSKGWQ